MEGSREPGTAGETNPFTARRTEFCGACTAETRHVATIRIEGDEAGAASGGGTRQPYRISRCTECGETTRRRAVNV